MRARELFLAARGLKVGQITGCVSVSLGEPSSARVRAREIHLSAGSWLVG